jgi:hypothetical protein
MTLCSECRYVRKENWSCSHPAVMRVEEQDPVTGKYGFVVVNDLGTTYFSEDKYPPCRNYNHGNCEMFILA